jgi:hypothetical protein
MTRTWRAAARELARALAVGVGMTLSAGLVSGCRVSESDVHRWEITERGPYKLVAVIAHEKYATPLRVDAALSLIRMPPRGGQRQGIKYLVNGYKDEDSNERPGALMQVSEEQRRKIVIGMAPDVVREIQAPPPAHNADGTVPPDPSIPFKDVAFALLSHEPPIAGDDATKKMLTDALTQWAQTGFEDRIENATQQYGMEQMMRYLGAPSVKTLPTLVNENTSRIDRIASLVADIGDPDTKKKLGDALVALAKRLESADWVAMETKVVDEHNKKSAPNTPVTKEQVAKQVSTMQDSKFTEQLFPAMKRVGGKAVNDYLFAYAGDAKANTDRRKLAAAALEGNIDKNNPGDADRLFAIARSDETPDEVRQLVFNRLGELPKEQIVNRLYNDPAFFSPKKWKVRWVAAELVLKTSSTKDVTRFMAHLPSTPNVKSGMTEGLSYGGLIAKIEPGPGDPKPRDAIMPYLNAREFGPKMTALGFFYNGKKADIGAVKGLQDDNTAVPKCDKDDVCQWEYDTPKAGGQPGDKDTKDLKTVGEFVKYVLIPSMTN